MVELGYDVEVYDDVEGHGLLTPCGVPGGAFVEVEEVGDTLSGLIVAGGLGRDAMDSEAKRVGRCAELLTGPFALSFLINGAYAYLVVGLGLEVFESEVRRGNGGEDLSEVLYFVIISTRDFRPPER